MKHALLNPSTRLDVVSLTHFGPLPALMKAEDGTEITHPHQWPARRAELYKTAVELQYGTQPPAPDGIEVDLTYKGEKTATLRIRASRGEKSLAFRVNVAFPQPKSLPCPFILDGDGCFGYHYKDGFIGIPTARGIGVAHFDRTELADDIQHVGRRHGPLYEMYPEYTFGAIGAWAWGYSRVVDALLKLGWVDPDWIVFTGHSRGGKTAMLAGALDARARIVNPNETCAGACSCYHMAMEARNENGNIARSERLSDLIQNFDFWMGEELAAYANCPEKLPFDEHFLKAMVAPRTLFVSEAVHDIWASPLGSYMTTVAAKPAFDLLGAGDHLYWYYRDGGHSHTDLDMAMLVNLILHERDGEALDEAFFRRPFDVEGII